MRGKISAWLESKSHFVVVLLAMAASFSAYLSMYAFRKPLAANSYTDVAGVIIFETSFDYKAIALIAQLIGYMCSKFLGVKFASEAPLNRRAPYVIGLILFAGMMLVLFAITPAPYNLIWLFFNGLPLGMVWSMLFGILEGRRITEFLGLAMSVSVVFASGWVKAVGLWTIQSCNVAPFWMPALTGAIFIPLLLISLGILYVLPPPDEKDVAHRRKRAPMTRADRTAFFKKYFVGVVVLIGAYLCLMTYRALRDDFMDLILADLGYELKASDFAGIESVVGVSVIVVLLGLWFFKNNRIAVWANMTLVGIGAVLTGVSTILMNADLISPKTFFVINGIGLYIAYVPFQCILIDRLLATLDTVATAAFLIAAADAAGYVAVVALYLSKNVYGRVTGVQINWAELLMFASYVVATLVPVAMIICAIYFRNKEHQQALNQ